MRKIGDIHVFEDEAFLHSIRTSSALVAIAGIAVAALWGFAMGALRDAFGAPVVPFELGAMLGPLGNRILGVESGQGFTIWWWILLALAQLASLALHELVHAFFFKSYAPAGTRVSIGAHPGMGMLYACAEGVIYPRDRYLVIVIAPSVAVSLLLMAVGLGLKWPLWTIISVTAHLCGCTGDWGYVRAILGDPAITHCEDTRYGVAFWGPATSPFPSDGAPSIASDRPQPRDASAPSRGVGAFTVIEGGRRP